MPADRLHAADAANTANTAGTAPGETVTCVRSGAAR